MTGSYFGMGLRDELAQALYALGRYDEARELSELSEREAAQDDVQAQVQWRALRSKLLAREGQVDKAEAVARAAVALVERTEFLIVHANGLMDLGEVLRLAGRPSEAISAVEDARRLYERKGDRVSAGRAEAALAELHEASSAAAQLPSTTTTRR
ncbi:MAG: hypothetical protein ACRDMA_18330 [Solirubrobacterales bacterium]